MLGFEELIQVGTIGLFTGFGSALGNYMAQRAFIKHFEKLGLGGKNNGS